MVVSLSHTIAIGYGYLTRSGLELQEVKSLRIPVLILDSKLTFETHLREVMSKTTKSLGASAEQESYLIAHVDSRAVSMHMSCTTFSIVAF